MAKTTAPQTNSGADAYYTTSHSLGNGTTSTAALNVWLALSQNLTNQSLPMTGAALSEATGLRVEVIDRMFTQTYYQRWYGFRRFETLEQWHAWAHGAGVLYNPELHTRKPHPMLDEGEDDEEMEDEPDEE